MTLCCFFAIVAFNDLITLNHSYPYDQRDILFKIHF